MEQRAIIKFHAKLGTTASKTYEMLQQVYGDDCLSRSNVFLWHTRFCDGRETLEDDDHGGSSRTVRTPEMIQKVRDFIAQDRNAPVRNQCGLLSCSYEAFTGQNHPCTT